ncbi:MAG: glycoside hydrolase family 32 protein [Lunatimonas sp.]|uniref:glycoside hydrolase family 32 protein n=1 Tax=Lunatimonas sp. TaxID=2060141 RepID=UPI00263B90AB|nr:glycoside hydrolase family 32 protein [Lunatimonas sp.]MCC5938978.1 glycoside hydrolase family 32 protein [Lunatimonas sp.]
MRNLPIAIIALLWMQCGHGSETTQTESNGDMYTETFRPQFHFSPPSQWMNDPNGMVFYQGEYHLFYQYHPESTVWGPMHWGHAVSKDLVHWENLPIALYPDELGTIFSGSAVIDHQNTSGLGSDDNPPMVAIYTNHHAEKEQAGDVDFQVQSIAYSLDKGRSWTKYAKNPVLDNPGIRDFRDPKVFWHGPTSRWVMALAVEKVIHLYTSENLLDWTFASEFGEGIGAKGGVWECPDLFPMNDPNGSEKWVMLVSINPGGPNLGSATQYFIGNFDGKQFTPLDTVIRWIDYGPDNYAGVTWSNIPDTDGRRLFIGWMSNWLYAGAVPTVTWRSAKTIPRSLSLKGIHGKHLLHSQPIDELQGLRRDETVFLDEKRFDLPSATSEIIVEIPDGDLESILVQNDSGEQVILRFADGKLELDRTQSGLSDFHADFANVHTAPLDGVSVTSVQIFLDSSSIEVFINSGELVMTAILFPTEPYRTLELTGGMTKTRVFSLASIWK